MTEFTIENTAKFTNKATKSFIKGALIDGITVTHFLLCLPFINDHTKLKSTTVTTAAVMEILTSKMFYYITSVYTVFASVSYYIRSEARDNEIAEIGGIIGDAISNELS